MHSFRSLTAFARAMSVLCAAALVIAACASGGMQRAEGPGDNLAGSGQQRPSVKVAFLLPLSAEGNTADVAKALKQAGELALFDFDNPNVTLMAKDTKGTPEGAQEAAVSAVEEGAELIIGPLFSKSVSAAAPVARQANVPMVAFSSDRTVAGDGVYLLSFLAGRDVPRIVSYAVGQGRTRFAALIPKTDYGQVVESAFRKAVGEQGGEIVTIEQYEPDANAMLEPAKRIAGLAKPGDDGTPPRIDAIFIPAGPETLPTVAALMPYYEIDTEKVKLLGTGRWDYANVGREDPLKGGWFPAPNPEGWKQFTQNYVKTYETTPPRLASLSYDAVSLAVSLSDKPPGKRYTRERLTRASGFAGVDGLFRLLPDGTSQRGLAILEVQPFGPRVIDPAPRDFGVAQY